MYTIFCCRAHTSSQALHSCLVLAALQEPLITGQLLQKWRKRNQNSEFCSKWPPFEESQKAAIRL